MDQHGSGINQFNGCNFSDWKFRMECLYEEKGLLKYLTNEPNQLDEIDNEWATRHSLAKNLLIKHVASTHMSYVKNKPFVYHMWRNLIQTFEPHTLGKRVSLKRKLNTIKCDTDENLEDYLQRYDTLVEDFKIAGGVIEDDELVTSLLATLPEKFDNIVTVLETMDDLMYDRAKSLLLEHETRSKNKTVEEEEPHKNPRRACRDDLQPRSLALSAMNWINDVPLNYKQVFGRSDEKQWVSAINDELCSLKKNQTWKTFKTPKDAKLLDTKWVFKIKDDCGNLRYKARLVVRGYQQREGVDFGETYSPVARMAITMKKRYEIRHLDVTTAFLYGNLEENVFLKTPEGVIETQGTALKLQRSLFGLKQAPKCWNTRFYTFINKIGFVRSKADYCLFTLRGRYGSNCRPVKTPIDPIYNSSKTKKSLLNSRIAN